MEVGPALSIVRFDGVSKYFRVHPGNQLLRDRLLRMVRRGDSADRFYALRDVSFSVEPGESVAFIGHNGAGKSTLLSLVAGLSPPDEGQVSVKGRVAALLELGSGFHYDLTGVENVRLNASLLGMSRRRTDELFDRIVDFAGIGEYLHEPVRTYSMGMVLRLAFSVAFHLDAEVLIIDEVIAVGDLEFQRKCLDRILELQRSGRTLLFVSHSSYVVQQFCRRAVWLDHGRVKMDGSASDVLGAYQAAVT